MSNRIVAAALLILVSPNLALGAGGYDAMGNATGYEDDSSPSPVRKAEASAPADPFKNLKFQDSPFEACKDVTMISNSDFKNNESFWKEAIGECGINVQILPDTGFFQTVASSLREQDVGTSSLEFLKKVGERAGSYQKLNNDLADHLRHCALKDKEWFDTKRGNATSQAEKDFYDFGSCEKVVAREKDRVKEMGRQARIKRAVLEATGSRWEGMKGFIKSVTGAKLPIETMPISADEMAEAKKIIAENDKAANDEFQNVIKENMAKLEEAKAKQKEANDKLRSGKFQDDGGVAMGVAMSDPFMSLPGWFKEWHTETRGGTNPNTNFAKPWVDTAKMPIQNKIWAQHKDEFLGILGQVPALAYIPSADPSDADIAQGSAEVLKNGEAELKDIRAKLAKANLNVWRNGRAIQTPTQEDKVKSLLEMMKYGPIVNELVKEDPFSCRTATGVANMILSSDHRKNAALIVGMVGTVAAAAVIGPVVLAGTALASPALLATGVGAAWGAKVVYGDHEDFVRARQRAFSVVETQENGRAIADVKDFDASRDQFVMSVALSPLDLVGSGLGVKGAKTLFPAFFRSGGKASLTAALKKRGLRDVEITKLLSDLDSTDAAIAGPAARKIMAEVGIDQNHVNFVRLAASKGLFKPESPEAFAAIMKEVKDRKINLKVANEVLADVNAAKINSGNREQVIRAALAGAEFGHRDPKKLAAVINDWDQGLDGLARTYEVAKAKMELPEIRGLATLEARQNASFSKALDEMMDANPEFKVLSAEERAAAKGQMMACGIKGN